MFLEWCASPRAERRSLHARLDRELSAELTGCSGCSGCAAAAPATHCNDCDALPARRGECAFAVLEFILIGWATGTPMHDPDSPGRVLGCAPGHGGDSLVHSLQCAELARLLCALERRPTCAVFPSFGRGCRLPRLIGEPGVCFWRDWATSRRATVGAVVGQACCAVGVGLQTSGVTLEVCGRKCSAASRALDRDGDEREGGSELCQGKAAKGVKRPSLGVSAPACPRSLR